MKNLIIISIGILLIISCKKPTNESCKDSNTPFYGSYYLDDLTGIYFIKFNNNTSDAKTIIGEDVKDKNYPICCQSIFSKKEGDVCFSFRLAENTEVPITPGPGPSPSTDKYIRILVFLEQ